MITVNEMSLNKFKIIALETEIQFGTAKPIIDFPADEVVASLQKDENDRFLMLSFKGELNELKYELRHINFPKSSVGDVIIIRGNNEIGLCDIMTVQEGFNAICEREEWNPILAFVIDDNCGDIEIDYITRLGRMV